MNEYRISTRTVLRPGDRFRLIGGPVYTGDDGKEHRMRLAGVFTLIRVIRKGRRIWLDCFGEEQNGGHHVVFVSGRSYRRHGILFQPFKIKKLR